MLGAVYLAVILLPLLLVLGSFVAFAVRRMDDRAEADAAVGEPASVTELRPADELYNNGDGNGAAATG